MDGYSRHDIRRWVDNVLLQSHSDELDEENHVDGFQLGEGVTLEAGEHNNLSARSEPVFQFIDDPVDNKSVSTKTATTTKKTVKSTKSTKTVSVAGSTPTEPETTSIGIEPPTLTQSLPTPAVTFTVSTVSASAQPQPITTLTPISHSARPAPTKTKDHNDEPEKTSSATITSGFVTMTTGSSTTAIAASIAITSSVTTSVLTSATASPAINNGAALEGVQQKEAAHGHMSGGAKAGIAIGVVAGVAMFGIVCFWLLKCFRSRKSEADSESSIRAFLSGEKSGENGLPPPATAAGGAGADQLSTNFDPRSNSQILDELIAASYAHQNGHDNTNNTYSIPNGYVLPTALDEKRADSAHPVTIIRPAPTHQPEIRKSVASWLRKHHPLKLNPLSIRGSTFSAFSRRASSAYGSSQQGGGRESIASDYPATPYDPDAPPMPEIPATYFNEISKPLSPMPKKPPTAAQNMKAMKFQSMWSDSSAGTDMDQDRSRMTVSSEGNESLFNLYNGQMQGGQEGKSPSQVVTSLSPPPLVINRQDQDQGQGQGQAQRASSPTLRP
ncbi:hypothetical protein SMACR_01554 [Sordaria macrospora]|uniref:WGS project CABT00000000 data, contig 2.4 n=2 Tax=Sordaria macrospora TaxID=5147 RepID=F7VR56_SORMK|nr:uncharacterized protein SMAC_01554 [Sordaria macrospora k-hell]KAA8635340.1 hypothetical protein SMACR_01554 [Sordaria macrospora]WPJ58558.1 hypothetical protein SMAC4_01554 [Sordaria macrospora]CCC07989.1 unnamed protein product [Sordaria macrospora k-hell]